MTACAGFGPKAWSGRKALLYKTRMCVYWRTYCRDRARFRMHAGNYGRDCPYAHTEHELRMPEDNTMLAYRAKWQYLFSCGYERE